MTTRALLPVRDLLFASLGIVMCLTTPRSALGGEVDLSLSLAVTPAAVATGFRQTNVLTVINHGPDVAPEPRLVYWLGQSLHLVALATTQGSLFTDTGLVMAELGPLQAGQTAVVTVVYVPITTGNLRLLPDVRMEVGGLSDPHPENNAVLFDLTVTSGLGVLQFSQPIFSGLEGREAALTVLRTGSTQGTAGVHFALLPGGGSAQAGQDHLLTNGQVTFAPGEAMKTILWPLTADRQPECNEGFTVELFDPVGPAVALGQIKAIVVIEDQDWLPGGTVRGLSVPPDQPLRTVGGQSWGAQVSGDGRSVVFVCSADGIAGDDFNASADVFVRDLAAETNGLISVNRFGTESGNGASDSAVVSADGRFVAFRSAASDLTIDDTNDVPDVFIRDRLSGHTALVSATPDGLSANLESYNPVLSSNGHVVAFVSLATNLTPGVRSQENVYVRDLLTGLTRLASRRSGAPVEGNGASYNPVISADGRFVAFGSDASNLVDHDNNDFEDVFLYDRLNDTVTLVSERLDGLGSGNLWSIEPAISADGRRVAFTSAADDLVDVAQPPLSGINLNVFVRDLQAGTTELVSINALANATSALDSSGPSISADGRHVAFASQASDLVPPGAGFDFHVWDNVFVRDLTLGVTRLVSLNCQQTGRANGMSSGRISGNGRSVVLLSFANDMAPGHQPGELSERWNVYRHDLDSGGTELVSFDYRMIGVGNDESALPSLSFDGATIAFASLANNLIPEDDNGTSDVFVWQQLPSANSAQLRLTVQSGAGEGVLFWNLAVTNLGPHDATAVVITNPLPPGATLLAANSTAGSCSVADGVVRCELGTLAWRTGAEVTVFALPAAEGFHASSAGVTAAQPDLFALDNVVHWEMPTLLPAANRIAIVRNGSSVCVTWLDQPPGTVLERATSLGANAVWSPVTQGLGGNGVVRGWMGSIAPANTSFFRVQLEP